MQLAEANPDAVQCSQSTDWIGETDWLTQGTPFAITSLSLSSLVNQPRETRCKQLLSGELIANKYNTHPRPTQLRIPFHSIPPGKAPAGLTFGTILPALPSSNPAPEQQSSQFNLGLLLSLPLLILVGFLAIASFLVGKRAAFSFRAHIEGIDKVDHSIHTKKDEEKEKPRQRVFAARGAMMLLITRVRVSGITTVSAQTTRPLCQASHLESALYSIVSLRGPELSQPLCIACDALVVVVVVSSFYCQLLALIDESRPLPYSAAMRWSPLPASSVGPRVCSHRKSSRRRLALAWSATGEHLAVWHDQRRKKRKKN